jgi:zinc protease
MKKQLLFLLAITILLSLKTNAQEIKIPEGVKFNASVEGITEYQLKNGLKVLLFPDQSKPTITVNITYMVGSRHEGYGETGMAHLLEHLVFKGTPNHPNIPQELTEHGARPNGTTWYDRTNYFETFSATEENLKWALDLEADRMINSFIAKKDLDSEMTVVRNEFESGENSPSSVLMERVLSTGYLWHNYGKSTIGCRADLENVPIDRLQAFYKKYYQPDNAVLLVAGKFDEEKTLALIDGYYSNIPVPDRKLFPTYTKEPTQDGERAVTLRRTGDLQVVSCMYHTAPGAHQDYASIAILDEILTNEPAGRLYKALVETKKASLVWSFAPALKEGGFIYINADVRKDNSLQEAEDILINTLDELKNNPITQEELDRSKAKLLKYWELAYNASDRVGMRLSEYIAQGDWRLFFLFRDAIENVTLEDITLATINYFKPSNRTIGKFIPEEKPDRVDVPAAPDLALLTADYKGKEMIAVGEAFDPSPDNIDSRTLTAKLDSGAEVAYLSKENRGDGVSANITLRFGTPNSLVGKSTIGRFTARMLDKGTKTLTRQEIEDKLDKLKARVNVYGGVSNANARIETTNENLLEVLDITNDILRNPVFSQEEFEKLIEEELAGLEESLSDPQSLAGNTFSRALSNYPKSDVRYVMTLEEQIAEVKALKLEDIVKFYNDYYGASDATISVVGDFDQDLVDSKVKKYFGDWKSPSKYVRITDPYVAVKGEEKDINTPDKANAMFLAGINLPINDSHEDYTAMVIGNYMLGGGFLNSRLATRIRQKEGLSYGVGSWFNASSEDESGNFGAYAIYAPENRDKVQAAFKEEIMKVKQDGFTQEELDAARNGWLQSQQVSRSQDGRLVGSLNSNLRLDRTFQWDKKMEEKMSKLTVSDVNAVMAKYLDPEKMVYVKAGDFEKAFKVIKP